MAKEEHNKEQEEEPEGELRGVKASLTLGSVASSAFGLLVAVGNITAKAVTGDILGAAEGVSSALSVIGKASGLSPIIEKAGGYLKDKFGDSAVIGAVGKAWKVATSRPAKMALKIAGIGLAIAAAPTPIGWGIIALSAGAMVASTVIGSRNIGRNKRIVAETKALEEAAHGIGAPEKGKIPALDRLLAAKLAGNKVHEVNGAKIGASVARGSIMESAALILEAAGDADNLAGVAAAGVAVFGGLADEAKEAIERQEKRNRLLATREEARVKVVGAILAKEPGIDNLIPEALEEKYNSVYKAQFQKGIGAKVKNFFKDVGSGFGEFMLDGIKKVFAKKAEHAVGTEAHTKEHVVAQGLNKERAADAIATPPQQIPTHIEVVETGQSTPPPPLPQSKHSQHHAFDPHYMATHTDANKTEHGQHPSEGNARAPVNKERAH